MGHAFRSRGSLDYKIMLKKHSSLIKYIALSIDLALIELNWFVWYKLTTLPEYGLIHEITAGKFNSWKTGTVLAITWIVLTGASRFYASKRAYTIISEWWDAVKYLFSVTVVFIFFASVFLDVHLLSRGAFTGFYATALITLIIERTIMRLGLRIIRAKGFNYRNVLIVGAGNVGNRIAQKIEVDHWLGYKIVGFLDDNKHNQKVLGKYPVLGSIDEFDSIAEEYKIDKIIICLPMRAYKKLETILTWLGKTLLDCSVVPDIYHFQMLHSGIRDLDGIPLVDVVSTPIEGTDALIKRVADVVLSIVILAISSPLLLLIAIGVKFSSPGPVLFVQKRHGESGEVFNLYKFRSMRMHREENGELKQATKDDPRVTKFGQFLRRTSLDELPQFLNVIKGDMSIVGPRPHAVAHDEYYQKRIAPYLQRFRIKPGITGWAQVNGWRGETSAIEDMEKRIEHDLEYIQNWDIWLDFKIIIMTLYRGFVDQRAY